METFNIQPIERFAGSSAAIRRPKEFTHFSYDDEHKFHLDERSLRYYYTPAIGANLSQGFETFQQLDDSEDDHLDSLLKTIIAHEEESGSTLKTDIVTWRGMITKIMATPYENMNGFEMNATRFQDTIFIEEDHAHKLESRKVQQSQPSYPGAPSQELMSYWGYKFETLSQLPDTWDATSRDYIEGREEMVVNNHAQYCSVVKTGIGKTKMILGGEVDALWDSRPDNKDAPINWVELKTSAEILTDRDAQKYERKLLKFWIQSFLLGVPKIIVGFRSKEGYLRRLEEIETKEIPGIVKSRRMGTWDGNLCINFTAAFLEWLKQTITTEHGVWRIRRREKSSVIEVFQFEEAGYGGVLSPEFVQWRNKGSEEKEGGEA